MVQETTPGGEQERKGSNESGARQNIVKQFTGKKDITDSAREKARGDIEADADMSIHSPNDDPDDEGETVRLGEGRNTFV